MPTYDYHCQTCGNEFEHFQSMSAPKLTTCLEETCVGTAKGQGLVIRKISGGAGLVFNGDGFYVTDYVKKDSAASSKSSSKTGAASDSASDSGSTSDSKAASSTDSSPTAPSSPAPTA